MLAIPLAWLQLIRERVRLLVAVAGITFAVVLMMIQLGFRDALFEAAVMLHRNLNCDVVMISPQSTNLFALKSFSRRRLYQVGGIEGVESFTPVYLRLALWRNPETRGTRQILIAGIEPESHPFTLEGVKAQQDLLKKSDVVLFDRLSRPEFGPVPAWFDQGRVVETELEDRRLTVKGLFSLGASFAADGNLITSDLNFLRFTPSRSPGLIDLGLITAEAGLSPEILAARIDAALPDDVMIFTKAGFVQFEQRYWQTSTAIGFIFSLGSAMGFIVGTVIVYQILYTDVSDHLAEYATLKAMGYRNRYLFGVVIQEAIILSVLGYIPGLLGSMGLYSMTRKATALPLSMTVERGMVVFSLTALMCLISGAIAMRKVQAADPADIF